MFLPGIIFGEAIIVNTAHIDGIYLMGTDDFTPQLTATFPDQKAEKEAKEGCTDEIGNVNNECIFDIAQTLNTAIGTATAETGRNYSRQKRVLSK